MSNNSDQHNQGGLIAFIFSVGFCLAFFIYISFIHPGVDLKEVQEPAADGAPVFNMTSVEKPWIEDAQIAAHGSKVYANNCAVCHGATGAGDGAGGAALNPKPRNFVEGKWTKGGDSKGLYVVIRDGIPGTSMAPFKHLAKGDRWALVQYVRSVTNNKVKDDPAALEKFAASAD